MVSELLSDCLGLCHDIGVAGGDGIGLIFKHGETLKRVPEDQIVPALMEELAKL